MSRTTVRRIAHLRNALVVVMLVALVALASHDTEQLPAVATPSVSADADQDAVTAEVKQVAAAVAHVSPATQVLPARKSARSRCRAMSFRPSVSHSWDHVRVGSGPIQEAAQSSIQIANCPGSAKVPVLRGSYNLAGTRTKCVHVRRVYFSWKVWQTDGPSYPTIVRSLPCEKDTTGSGVWRIRGIRFYPPETYGGPTYPTVFNARGYLKVDTRFGGDHTHKGKTWLIAVP